jgi:hypothetical protein
VGPPLPWCLGLLALSLSLDYLLGLVTELPSASPGGPAGPGWAQPCPLPLRKWEGP